MNYIFCTDKDLLEINRQFLKHDYYTDIITFDLSLKGGAAINGEVYISIDRVRENAATLQETVQRELHRVIFHGVPHLCGYKDKSDLEKKKRRENEEGLLKQYLG